jgi:site-specific DNA recombinase
MSITPTVSGSSIRMGVKGALYARVSSDQQATEQTIDSQLAKLREQIAADGTMLDEAFVFIDDGVSGKTLARPSLEKLRDAAYAGQFQKLYVHSPDRLARKYAYQVLLVDELREHGIDIIFINHAIGQSPEEEMLLQMQGMFAEYERAKIMERSRRGKRHAACCGSVSVLSAAPFGYRYLAKHEGEEATYVVDPEQATAVRQMFEWVGRDRLSINEVCRRLEKQGTRNSHGKIAWSRSSVWNLLKNPAFCGRALYGKTRVDEARPSVRPSRGRSQVRGRENSRYSTSTTDQIAISVPAIVDEALFSTVQDQLKTNQQVNRERCDGARHLLQGLVVCGCCGYAYYGMSVTRGETRYTYYRCAGTDAHRFGGKRVCQNTQVRIEPLDDAVWRDVQELLREPQLLRREYERRLQSTCEQGPRERTLRLQERDAQGTLSRLIDAYERGLLEPSDFEIRVKRVRERLKKLEVELGQLSAREAEKAHLKAALSCLDEFATRISSGLDEADWQTRRQIIRLLIEKILIEETHVRLVYRITFPLFLQMANSKEILPRFTQKERVLQLCLNRAGGSAFSRTHCHF